MMTTIAGRSSTTGSRASDGEEVVADDDPAGPRMSLAAPAESSSVPSVARMGSTRTTATRTPDRMPTSVAARQAAAMASGSGRPWRSARSPTTTGPRSTTPPTDRSMPPASSTTVAPIAATPTTMIWTRMLRRFDGRQEDARTCSAQNARARAAATMTIAVAPPRAPGRALAAAPAALPRSREPAPSPASSGQLASMRPSRSPAGAALHREQQVLLGGGARVELRRRRDPRNMTSTRSQMPSTSGRSVETTRMPVPSCGEALELRGRSRPWRPTSTPRVGSMQTSSAQPRISQRARIDFCWLPPLSVMTWRGRTRGAMPVRSAACATSAALQRAATERTARDQRCARARRR